MKPFSEHMVSCPKCGGSDISVQFKETWDINAYREELRWFCRQCTYNERTKCKDGDETILIKGEIPNDP